MTNIQEISFEKYDSESVKAICTICLDDQHLVSYAKKTYEGREWWAQADHFVKLRNGKNVKVEGYLPESRSMDMQIKNFLNKCEEKHYTSPIATSMDEVADTQCTPF